MPLNRAVRAVAGIGAVLALVGVAACTDSGHAQPAPTATLTATSSPTPTPSPTPTSESGLDFSGIDLTVAPPRPAALDKEHITGDEAQQIARYFMLLYPYMFVTHDTTAYEELSHPLCKYCGRVLADVLLYADDHVSTERGAFIVQDTSARVFMDDYYIVTMTYAQDWSRETARDGTVVAEGDGFDSKVVEVDVLKEGRHWMIGEVVGITS